MAKEDKVLLRMRHGDGKAVVEVPGVRGKKWEKEAPEIGDCFEGEGVRESLLCTQRRPSRKKDRRPQPQFESGFGKSLDGYNAASDAVNSIGLLPICYIGNKKRMLLGIWNFLDDNGVEFSSVFDAFSGSCTFSFFCRMLGKDVIANDIMGYPSVMARSLLDPSTECPTDEELDILMGNELNPSNNNHWTTRYKDVFFTEAECEFLDRYRSNIISMWGPVAVRGMDRERKDMYIGLDGNPSPSATPGMMKASFAIYLVLTLLHHLCFTGGRFFRRQIMANVDYRLHHVRNKGGEIHSRPKEFMWLKEVRKFLSVIPKSGGVDIFSEDVVPLLSSGNVNADMVYLDPPYGGMASDYAWLYRIFEEYIWGVPSHCIPYLGVASKRFKKPKGYRGQLDETLTLCEHFPVWLVSYNQRSFSSLEDIVGTIKKFRGKVEVSSSEIKYRYRKGAGEENEFLILARK